MVLPSGPFVSDTFPQSRTDPIGFDISCAKKLNQVALARRKSPSARYVSGWVKHFRLLRTEDGVSPDVIEAVLNWYLETDWNAEFAIQAFCGASFRKKFERLYIAWQKDLEEEDRKEQERLKVRDSQVVADEIEKSRLARMRLLGIDADG